jgi:hypothetical protein
LTLASGNSAIWQLKNDHFIRVKNDSCVEFWLLAIAWGDHRPPSDGGAGGVDAGADVTLPFELRELAKVE